MTGVAADDVLNIRERPDAGARIIGVLAPDVTAVEVISVQDGWARVNLDDRSGYVALRYLARQSGPGWNALGAPLTCLGTEPFWSLQIDPATRETRFATPETPEPQAAPITKLWPGRVGAPAAAVALPDGLAVLSPAQCSDGMSDRSYGIAVDLFLDGAEISRLSGCCRLAAP